jgi:hypothetical protein
LKLNGAVGGPLPPHGRGRASIASLIALLAIAGGAQALAPAPAAAMVSSEAPGQCVPVANLAGVGWNGVSLCVAEEQGAGGAAIPGTGRPGEVIQIRDTPPAGSPRPCPYPGLCLPQGGGAKGSDPDRGNRLDDAPPPRGGSPTKGEVKKPKAPPKRVSKQEKEVKCRGVLKILESRLYKEIPSFWNAIQGLDPSLAGEPYPLEVKRYYSELQALLRQWQGLGCVGLLRKSLPFEYVGVRV